MKRDTNPFSGSICPGQQMKDNPSIITPILLVILSNVSDFSHDCVMEHGIIFMIGKTAIPAGV
jgi:hypothetical protein